MTGQSMFRVGLEIGIEGRSMAWVLGHPGCFAYSADGDAALAKVPETIRAYGDWLYGHSGERWLPEGSVEFDVVDTWQVYHINRAFDVVEDGYSVESWFRDDWRPLTEAEVARGLQL
jgi:hypothetical protein